MDPVSIVDEYLQLCEERRLEEAGRCLSDEARLVFPGGKLYANLEEMTDDARTRYRWIRKQRDDYAVGSAGGRTTVVSRGTLYGENLALVSFHGVRYIDLLFLEKGKIVGQHVWNDLCESGVLQRGPAGDKVPTSKCST